MTGTRRSFPSPPVPGPWDEELTPVRAHDCEGCAFLRARVSALEAELAIRTRDLRLVRYLLEDPT